MAKYNNPENCWPPDGRVAYTSSNPEVASVASNGQITAHEVGEAVITVTVGDLSGSTAIIEVFEP
jgi:uncharacterized protein YjdB